MMHLLFTAHDALLAGEGIRCVRKNSHSRFPLAIGSGLLLPFSTTMSKNILDLDPLSRHKPGKGRLLVSEPYLPDPYFRRTVVLLCDHTEEGSFGFVLNRHMDMAINDLMENLPPISNEQTAPPFTSPMAGAPTGTSKRCLKPCATQ